MPEMDPRLIRFVTRHLNDLKGIHKVPFAGMMIGAEWAWSGTGSVLATFLGGLAGFLVTLIPCLFVAETYNRLGRVATSQRPGVWSGLIGGGAVMLMRLQTQFIPGPSVVWLAIGFYLLWFAIDGWPWRWYYTGAFAAAVYVAFGRVAMVHPTDFAWMAPRVWVFALAWSATSIADHFLQVRVMRPTDDAAEDYEHSV